jgi:hypothetical protein
LAIRSALEAAGVGFIDANGGGPGVRLKGKAKKDTSDALLSALIIRVASIFAATASRRPGENVGIVASTDGAGAEYDYRLINHRQDSQPRQAEERESNENGQGGVVGWKAMCQLSDAGQAFAVLRIVRRPRNLSAQPHGCAPEVGGNDQGIDALVLPPGALISSSVELAIVQPADRDGEAVADPAAHRLVLRKPDVVGV